MAFSRQLFIIANFSILNVFRSPGYVDENIEDIDEIQYLLIQIQLNFIFSAVEGLTWAPLFW